jgi:hypothetical protein
MDYNNNLEEALLSKKETVEDKKVYNNLDINLKEWNDDIEDLLKCWGEKSGGLAILHNKASQYYTLIMYLVGIIGMISSLLQSFKQFYNADEKASEHRLISKQYSNFYRSIKLQLTLKREDRVIIKEFVNWAFKEYERLQQEAPIVNENTIIEFKEKYKQYNCYKPDICENDLIIQVNGRY